jgi:NAD(P)-dependent dehydrogenase (short-subunit alcohol dehydrogenase family)
MSAPERKAVLVTGGAQGIGKALVRAFLQHGFGALLVDNDEEAGRETAAEYAALGPVHFCAADVGRPESAALAVNEALDRLGGLQVLINNAGVFAPRPMEQVAPEEWLRTIAVNLNAAFFFSRQAAPHLRGNSGAIINIASTRAHMSEPHTEAYSASKGGLLALTHAMAISLGPEIRVNCISPGWIDVSGWKKRSARHSAMLSEADHRQHPAGRVGTPEDVAALALWLAGTKAGFVTGQEFVIDGGMTRKMIYV